MTRSTDFPRPPQSRGQPRESAAVETATSLIGLAMHESQGPVVQMSGALARMAESLCRTGDTPPDRALLIRELATCIENLQFHDRLVQQLAQVRNLLSSLAIGAPPSSADTQSWNVLVENIRARFTSETHRILFNLLLPSSGGHSSVPSLHAHEGSIELF